MMKITDITFYANSGYTDTNAILKAQQASLWYIRGLGNYAEVEVIKHVADRNTRITKEGNTRFFVSMNKPGYIPRATIQHLKKSKPDVVFVHGLIFPLQVMRMKIILGAKVKILAWHHADRPQRSLKRILQRLADRCIDKYLFTSAGNAEEWFDAGIISDKKKIAEVPPTLTVFSRQSKQESKQALQMYDGLHYLWIGRLDEVKDPETVIAGFEKYLSTIPSATLHMIYQSGELLEKIKDRLDKSPWLKGHIILHGKIPHEQLEVWYSAADFLLSGSRSEGGSVALLEAMACGCIPIVTAIPAAMKVLGDGKYGFSYRAGDATELTEVLIGSANADLLTLSSEVVLHFEKEYSVTAVAEKLFIICRQLSGK